MNAGTHTAETNLSAKTQIFNFFRNIFKWKVLENMVLPYTQHKSPDDFITKLIPNNYQYEKPTWRTALRNGIVYHLDISDYMEYCIYYGIQSEPRTLLYNLIDNGTTVIDVGTNIGETLLNFARINSAGINYGFEPVPHIYERALKNIHANSFHNIKLHNIAIGDKDEWLTFHQPVVKNSGSLYMSKSNDNSPINKVEATTLDHFVQKQHIGKISLIKIDTEGFELHALHGAANIILEHRPTLFIEVDNNNLLRQGHTAQEMISLLLKWNYKVQHAETGVAITADYEFNNQHFDIVATGK